MLRSIEELLIEKVFFLVVLLFIIMSQVPLNPDEVTRYVQESVLYFLSQHSKNSTIKRLDYAKAILTDTGRRMQNEVIKQTKKVLKLVRVRYSSFTFVKLEIDILRLLYRLRRFMG